MGALGLDQLAHPVARVGGEPVEHDHVASDL
jgi:hypothetical protein